MYLNLGGYLQDIPSQSLLTYESGLDFKNNSNGVVSDSSVSGSCDECFSQEFPIIPDCSEIISNPFSARESMETVDFGSAGAGQIEDEGQKITSSAGNNNIITYRDTNKMRVPNLKFESLNANGVTPEMFSMEPVGSVELASQTAASSSSSVVSAHTFGNGSTSRNPSPCYTYHWLGRAPPSPPLPVMFQMARDSVTMLPQPGRTAKEANRSETHLSGVGRKMPQNSEAME